MLQQGKCKVLIVDDQPEIREVIKENLEQFGFIVEATGDAAHALELLKEGEFSIALIDKVMPEVNGHALVRAIQDQRLNLPIVMVSGHASADDVIHAYHQGVADFITKPFSVRDLVGVINSVLHPESAEATRAGRPTAPPVAPAAASAERPQPPKGNGTVARMKVELGSGRVSLPAPEPMIMELTQALGRPDLGFERVCRIVEQCPPIAAGVLHLARTAEFCPKGLEVKSVLDAVRRVGLQGTLNVARTLMTEMSLVVAAGPLAKVSQKIWENMVATAAVARSISKQVRGGNADRSYLVALFHNVGELLVFRLLMQQDASAVEFAKEEIENDIAEHHEALGFALCKSWSLDPICCEVARRHHDSALYEKPGVDEAVRTQAAMAVLAHQLVVKTNGSYLAGQPESPTLEQCLDLLGLRQTNLPDLLGQARSDVQTARHSLRTVTGFVRDQ